MNLLYAMLMLFVILSAGMIFVFFSFLEISYYRALQVPADAWLRFNLFHCSITHLVLTSDGRIICYGIGDVGHIPQERRSYV
jgi:hypothetical protein